MADTESTTAHIVELLERVLRELSELRADVATLTNPSKWPTWGETKK